jgi:hypothetical protein
MSNSADSSVLTELESIRDQLRARLAFVESADDLPKPWGGSGIVHIEANPEIVFHFLEFIFEIAYVDIMQEAGFRFLDDKTTWEYFVMTENGFLRIYDWKGYAVSVGSFGPSGEELKKDAEYLKLLVEDNINKFDAYRQVEYKEHIDNYPLDNFMSAFIALTVLFRDSMEEIENTHNYIEVLILLVALLDTQLRYSILLTRINVRKTNKVDPDLPELFQQVEDNKYISERGIYKLAEEEVDFPEYDKQLFFKRINELYNIRNRAVHRFAITNFQYSESKLAVDKYRDLVDVLFEIVKSLEHEQAQLGVGFIKPSDLNLPDHEMRREVGRAIGSKIDTKAVLPRMSERVPMFSDAYPDGYHPSLKETMKEIKKELEKTQSED